MMLLRTRSPCVGCPLLAVGMPEIGENSLPLHAPWSEAEYPCLPGSRWQGKFDCWRSCCYLLPRVSLSSAVGDATQWFPFLGEAAGGRVDDNGQVMVQYSEKLALWGLWQDYGRQLDEFWKRSNSPLYLKRPFNFQSCKLKFLSLIFEECQNLDVHPASPNLSYMRIRKVCTLVRYVVYLIDRDLAFTYNTELPEQK